MLLNPAEKREEQQQPVSGKGRIIRVKINLQKYTLIIKILCML
jgi:hypothetical protein